MIALDLMGAKERRSATAATRRSSLAARAASGALIGAAYGSIFGPASCVLFALVGGIAAVSWLRPRVDEIRVPAPVRARPIAALPAPAKAPAEMPAAAPAPDVVDRFARLEID